MHTVSLSSAVGSIVSDLTHFIFVIIIKYYCSYIPFASTQYSSLLAFLEIEDIHNIPCSAKKEHVAIWFGPLIVTASDLFIFLILSGQIKIGQYFLACHVLP